MKNITRLALAFAVAAIACLSPMSHAEDETQLVGSGIPSVRYYVYDDEDGKGTMLVKDGANKPDGKWIYVTITQNGYTFSGKGWRSLASEETNWWAQCEFSVTGGGITAKFEGYMPLKPGYGKAWGIYYRIPYASGDPYYGWHCYFDMDA
jgi:hypothetical protein